MPRKHKMRTALDPSWILPSDENENSKKTTSLAPTLDDSLTQGMSTHDSSSRALSVASEHDSDNHSLDKSLPISEARPRSHSPNPDGPDDPTLHDHTEIPNYSSGGLESNPPVQPIESVVKRKKRYARQHSVGWVFGQDSSQLSENSSSQGDGLGTLSPTTQPEQPPLSTVVAAPPPPPKSRMYPPNSSFTAGLAAARPSNGGSY
ncbi:hypothetical protein B0H67DRAFT_340872 [Lasiosphaeris hirsuta]|uniref:Uncharacterized protein n=1 Tax=Lasiosphaeris hirsuta TaxID=260670 RepID=A0AA40DPJ2_9PEZI|nr:hypothetical protein B0H67DRAFT_340872 [Lasiosphaeris hirsuta]